MTEVLDITAFKRAPSVEMSTWYKGILISSLATTRDTGGAFDIVLSTQRRGTEPPPHVHDREDEFFYVLEGEVAVFVGNERLTATAGECVFLPMRKPHAFKIQSPELRMLVLITPGGFLDASASMATPAQSLAIPPEDGITYATVDLTETIKVFERFGVHLLSPDEIARDLPLFLLEPDDAIVQPSRGVDIEPSLQADGVNDTYYRWSS